MGCTSPTCVYVTNETQPVHSLVETNFCLLSAPVLQRSRNFQWYWNSTKDQEQWQKYTDVENEFIEDAYNEKVTTEVEIDGNCIIDFEHLVQYKKNDLHKQFRIKRVQLDRNRTNVHLRQARFVTPVMLAAACTPLVLQKDPLPKQYWKLELENKIKTMADLAEDAALGIIKEGAALGKVHEARWLAKQLFTVKHFGNDVKAQYSRVPREIGETCVYLYTKESFWYKSVNGLFRKPETVTIDQLKTYGPFCHLMHWYLKKNHTTDSVTTVYRGLNLNDEQRQEFTKANIKFTSFTSATKTRGNAEHFGNTLLIIHLNVEDQFNEAEDVICGADISALSDFPDEEEFLIWPGSDFRFVKEEYDRAKEKYVIYLESSRNDYI
ncbi:unnamed protein product [Didymodactylos carnosus]|uniref:NAD(P)(+)--arginine ADP-ribosyltransferase n=1 Tax=Didymodactylos carnosus TaxID=1234261 RepID=A0A814UEW7_9BILA|nr:unnamed protein product [Didymodactylos carnosus]CAF3936528.1 unnamed protein product [Didymodactylos carnosus]